MKKTAKLLALVLALAMAFSLCACGTTADQQTSTAAEATTTESAPAADTASSDAAAAEPAAAESTETASEYADTINILISAEPVTLNMIESDSNLDTYVFYLTSAMLFRSIDNVVTPELCDTMTVSDDGCTYTYTIKEAYYTDGTKITADDFVYYMVKKYLTSENSYYFVGGEDTYNNSLDTCEGIYAVDDSTFVVTLTSPIVTFNGELEIFPVNRDFVAQCGDTYGGTPADLQYSGPYILDDWTVGSSLTLHKNPDYINADTLFQIENVNLSVASDASTIYSAYSNNEVDVIVSVSSDLQELIGQEACGTYPSGNLYGLEFNTTGFTYSDGDGFTSRGDEVTALMQNKNFRMALCAALDREAMTASIDPSSTPWNRYTDPTLTISDGTLYDEAYPLTDVIPLSGDTAAAQEYLAAALEELGYSDVSELPTITFLTFENKSQKAFAETCASLWKSVLGLENVEINLQPIQSAIMSMVYMDYDIYLQQLSTLIEDPYQLASYWETTGSVADVAGFQASGVPSFMASMHINEEFDALMTSVYSNFDEASRLADFAEAEQMLYSDYVYFPLQAGGGYEAVADYVQGWVSPYIEDGYGLANAVVLAH